AGPALRQPREIITQAVGALQRLLPGLELDTDVEVPAEEHDALLGVQHRGFRVTEVVGGVDDQGEASGRLDAPARPPCNENGLRVPQCDALVPAGPHVLQGACQPVAGLAPHAGAAQRPTATARPRARWRPRSARTRRAR